MRSAIGAKAENAKHEIGVEQAQTKLRLVKIHAQQLLDPFDMVKHGVSMHVQDARGLGGATLLYQVDIQQIHQICFVSPVIIP